MVIGTHAQQSLRFMNKYVCVRIPVLLAGGAAGGAAALARTRTAMHRRTWQSPLGTSAPASRSKLA